MAHPTPTSKPTEPARSLPEEADIGSGEKGPGEHDTEKIIEEVGKPPLIPSKKSDTPVPKK